MRKAVRRKLNRAVSLLAFGLVLAGCDVGVTEVDRVPSPDGKVDLVITTTDGGATTSVGYHVSLVAPGDKAEPEASVFYAEKVWNFKASWASPNRVIIQCGQARVFHFKNFWMSRRVDNFQHEVEIGLKGCAD